MRYMILAGLLALTAGVRVTYDAIYGLDTAPVPLRRPFSEFGHQQLRSGLWGVDNPLPENVQRTAAVTEYVNRRYGNDELEIWFYVGYSPVWSVRAIHYPDACFPAVGLDLVERRRVTIDGIQGVSKSDFHEYEWTKEGSVRTYTLSTFVHNGKLEPTEFELRVGRSGVRWFAILTVSGPFVGDLEATREFYSELLRELIPDLLEHFPAAEDAAARDSTTPRSPGPSP